MSEYRSGPLKGSRVITENRRMRGPRKFLVSRHKPSMSVCAFCPGRKANSPGGLVRMVASKFPALRSEDDLNQQTTGLSGSMPEIGAHKVIIETLKHHHSHAHLDISATTATLQAYRGRQLDQRQDRRFRYLRIFKNHGSGAGTPLPHNHSQLMALPVTSPVGRSELKSCRKYFLATVNCRVCAQPVQDVEEFAVALQNRLCRLYSLLQEPPCTFILHTASPSESSPGKADDRQTLTWSSTGALNWSLASTSGADFEWGNGFLIKPLAAEGTAHFPHEIDPGLNA